jgi:hypothetical protein
VKNFPEALGDENPNNQRIEELFGNQGGHWASIRDIKY